MGRGVQGQGGRASRRAGSLSRAVPRTCLPGGGDAAAAIVAPADCCSRGAPQRRGEQGPGQQRARTVVAESGVAGFVGHHVVGIHVAMGNAPAGKGRAMEQGYVAKHKPGRGARATRRLKCALQDSCAPLFAAAHAAAAQGRHARLLLAYSACALAPLPRQWPLAAASPARKSGQGPSGSAAATAAQGERSM